MRSLTSAILVGVVVCLLLTTGHPVPVGVVESTSMTPTLKAGDMFLAIPPGLVGGVAADDIAVFPGADGWTIHRVVAVEGGAVATAGDANPFVDQHAGDPSISTAAVAGIVPTIAGQPVAVGLPLRDHRLVGAIAGALLGLLIVRATNTSRRSLRPAAIGAIAATTTVLVWAIRRDASAASTSVTNTGPLPSVVISPGGESATLLWPTQSTKIDGGVPVPGWAPEGVLALASTVGGIAPVLVSAASTGLVVAVTAAIAAEVTFER